MPTYSSVAFGTCRLDLQTRELRCDGVLRSVAPKVFDLIALLVERYPRVVTKDELLNVLWPHQVVSEGAIARAVVQARKAVGDATLIRTVHSVGYRFVGELTPQGAASVQASASGKALRLGFLPIENRTGERQLDWIQLGLAALAIQSLESGARLAMASLQEILLALAPLPANAPLGDRVEAATRLLGLDGCMHATLRRQGANLWLDYHGQCSTLEGLTGSLCGDDPGELVQRMANDILASMHMGDGESTALVSRDPFINQAFARAAQMVAMHQFRAATKLLEVVTEFEPLSLPARLAHLRSLANLEDPSTDACAAAVIRLALERGDGRSQAQALHAAAQAHVLAERPGGLVIAAQQFETALQQAEPFGTEDWAIRLRVGYARTELLLGNFEQARALLEFAQSAYEASANHLQLAFAVDNRAWLEGECGEWLRAQDLLERALRTYRRLNLQSAVALTLMNLAVASMELGLLSRARDYASEGESLLDAVQQPHVAANIAECAACVYVVCGDARDIDRVLARLQPQHGADRASAKAQWHVARAMAARAHGDNEQARQYLLLALQMAQDAGSPMRQARRLQQLLALETAVGDPSPMQMAQEWARLLLGVFENAPLRAALVNSDAAACLATGNATAALQLLNQLLASAPEGLVKALARMEAGRLLLEENRPLDAQAMLRPLGPWLDEHPVARRLAARLKRLQHR